MRKQMIWYGRRVVEAEDLSAGDAHSERQAGNVVAVGVALDESGLATVTAWTRASVQLSEHLLVHLGHVIKGTCPVLITVRHHLRTSTNRCLSFRSIRSLQNK